jgi:hypothetical protein
MPNWIHNTMRVQGEPDAVRAFLEAINASEGAFDFNRIIPMPDIGDWWEDTPPALDLSDPKWQEKLGEWQLAREKNGKKSNDSPGWYEWSIKHWGTKWNAWGVEVAIKNNGRTAEVFYLYGMGSAGADPPQVGRHVSGSVDPLHMLRCRRRPDRGNDSGVIVGGT